MRAIVVVSVGALVCGALATGCVEEERVPARAHPAAAGRTTVVVSSRERPPAPTVGVTNAQPASPPPPVVTNVIEPPAPTTNVAPPAYGATAAQPGSPLTTEDDAEASRAVAEASTQIERLQRVQSTTPVERKVDVDTAITDLDGKRARVLQDLRQAGAQRAAQADERGQLERDLAELKSAVRASYSILPPPSQGLPQPAPLPPSDVR